MDCRKRIAHHGVVLTTAPAANHLLLGVQPLMAHCRHRLNQQGQMWTACIDNDFVCDFTANVPEVLQPARKSLQHCGNDRAPRSSASTTKLGQKHFKERKVDAKRAAYEKQRDQSFFDMS